MGDHYIPKYYLLGFSEKSEKSSIWVYDRGTKTKYQTQPKSTANSTNFYSPELESHLANNIEDPVKEILEKIKAKSSISLHEKKLFSHYIFTLYKRVPKAKQRLKLRMPEIAAEIKQSIFEEIDLAIKENPSLKENAKLRKAEIDRILAKQVENPAAEIWHHSIKLNNTQPINALTSMKWVFWVNQNDDFLTSDNPVFIFESEGIGRERSELSFPISSDICLWATRRSDINETYLIATDTVCKELNRRTVSNSSRFIYWKRDEPWIVPFLSKNHWNLNRII